MNPLYKKALSLTELIIAIVLLGTVFAAATAFNLATYKFYYSADKYAQTQLAIAPAMELISKNILQGIGAKDDPAVSFTGAGPPYNNITIRYDSTGNAQIDANDKKVEFKLQGNIIKFDPDITNAGDEQEIATRVVNLSFTPDSDYFLIDVKITARFVPTQIAGSDNPEVTLETSVSQRLASIN
ncbi:MAG: hypothetical protein Q8O13_02625 [Candidatus Omnitrophota bacterium]|nr:hypothetical protein [Candidatus Omnitrophota bacterium]